MNSKYNILWFDDDFLPLKQIEDPGFNETENSRRKAFHDEVKIASRYGLNVTGVYNLEQFTNAIAKIESFQAVIFDLRGLNQNNVFDDDVVDIAMERISNFKDLLVYVYSANDSDKSFRSTVRTIKEKGNCFFKGTDVKKLYKKIIEDLDLNLHYYQKHKECLELINNGFLGTNVRAIMDRTLSREYDDTYIPYNDMRKILEDMVVHLRKIPSLRIPDGKTNHSIKYITEYYESTIVEGKRVYDYTKPMIPFSICSVQLKKILSSLWDIVNIDSHNDNIDYLYLLPGETNTVYMNMQNQIVYISFYMVMKWYHGIMCYYKQKEAL